MRRIVQPYRIIFVDRARGWSLLFFGSSIMALVMAGGAHERRADPSSRSLVVLASIAFGALFLTAFWFLFRKRAFLIDVQARTLTVLQQRFILRSSTSIPLDQVSVRLDRKKLQHVGRTGPHDLTVGAIWLQIHGKDDIPFLDDVRGAEAEVLADQLAADLGRPLTIHERDDW